MRLPGGTGHGDVGLDTGSRFSIGEARRASALPSPTNMSAWVDNEEFPVAIFTAFNAAVIERFRQAAQDIGEYVSHAIRLFERIYREKKLEPNAPKGPSS